MEVQTDPLCGCEAYQIRLNEAGGKYFYWRVHLDSGEEYDRSLFASSERKLSAEELRVKLDSSSWLDLDCTLADSDFGSSKEVVGNIISFESSIIKKEWLVEWIDKFLDS
jgi:hypothetical protein